MPGFDGTGPRGLGPMTGGGRGYCVSSYPTREYYGGGKGFFGRGPGRGFGRGMGRGRSWENFWGSRNLPIMTEQQKLSALKSEADALREELQSIQEQISSLEKGKEPDAT